MDGSKESDVALRRTFSGPNPKRPRASQRQFVRERFSIATAFGLPVDPEVKIR
jgi:hypothetical protein